jgi:hypothetical protein
MATVAPTTHQAPSRRRSAGSPDTFSAKGSDVRRRLHPLPAPGLGATAARLSSGPCWPLASAEVIRPTFLQWSLAYVRTGTIPPVAALAPAASALLSMPCVTLLCGAAGYLLGSAFA